jgi:protein-S-isoprenylcysteine O-methyltransferase Ste14
MTGRVPGLRYIPSRLRVHIEGSWDAFFGRDKSMNMTNVLIAMRILLVNVSAAALWGLFAFSHYVRFQESSDFYLLLMVFAETWLALMFILRKAQTSKSTSPLEWVVAAGGTFLPLLLRPSMQGLASDLGGMVITLGVCIQVAGALSLNRSFGIVPANRGVRTQGVYRVIRHPLYASYLVTFSGYLLANTSWYNFSIVVASLVLMLLRILFEERHLLRDDQYRRYATSVRWRLVPYVF